MKAMNKMPFAFPLLPRGGSVVAMVLTLLGAGTSATATIAEDASSAVAAVTADTPATAATPVPPQLRVSSDGSEIIDQRARLAWMRCAEGMQWSGSGCTGRPLLLDRAQANDRARERSQSDGQRWRLPRVNELRRLVNKKTTPPGPDAQLFPSAPLDWHWSGTARIRQDSINPYNYNNIAQGRTGQSSTGLDVAGGWAVNLATGAAQGETARSSKLLVRLVRTLDHHER